MTPFINEKWSTSKTTKTLILFSAVKEISTSLNFKLKFFVKSDSLDFSRNFGEITKLHHHIRTESENILEFHPDRSLY